ncbi:hypothetical protein OAI44_00020 [Oceanospirillaceae bacterium]|nr:hypothetical protein [Oceanospirillaceae bacterium]
MKTSNNKIQQDIVSKIEDMFSAVNLRVVDFGPLEVNCFSICFWVDLWGPKGSDSIYIKVPKIIFYDQNKEGLGDISEEDRILAINEVDSLDYLLKVWDTSLEVRFVEKLGYLEKYNAIITKRIKADFLFKKFRIYDQFGKSNDSGFDPVKNGLCNFGTSLRTFHSVSSEATQFYADDHELKFEKYLGVLEKYGVGSKKLSVVKKYLAEHKGYSCDSYLVNNFKGIDIRQIFIKGNELFIIDPGKISTGLAEVDIARFVVTCRILYWGTSAIIRKTRPSVRYEKAFLDGYYASDDRAQKIIKFLIIKEVLKHWKMAHISLGKRNWKSYVKFFLRKIYIDSFYYKLLTDELFELN